jgi:hypothetical protein
MRTRHLTISSVYIGKRGWPSAGVLGPSTVLRDTFPPTGGSVQGVFNHSAVLTQGGQFNLLLLLSRESKIKHGLTVKFRILREDAPVSTCTVYKSTCTRMNSFSLTSQMAILGFVGVIQPALIVLAVISTLIILVHLLVWLVDPNGLRTFPGPFLARFSDLWLGRVAQQGHRSQVVHEMHEKYGACPQRCSVVIP